MKESRMPLGGNSRHHQTYTNEESTIRLYGYKTSLTRSLIVLALSFFTCGLFRLLLHWKPKLHLYFKATRCCFEDADLVYVVDDHNVSDICKVNRKSASDKEPVVVAVENGMLMELHEIRWFTYRKMKYTWVDDDWVTTNQVYNKTTVDDILASVNLGGLTDNDVELRRSYFGTNEMQIDLTSIPRIIVREIASPFYIFQAFSVTVWYIDEYVWYATLIIFMTFCTITVTIFQTREQEKRIRSMVQTEDTVVTVLRNKQKRVIPTSEVVPGDILVIPADGGVFHCDCLMLSGAAIVNESILTGESIPITKVPLTSDGHEETFSIESHRKNIIFCGSQVLQTRVAKGQEPKALVLRTSFSTMKGQLVRSIMYPKPVDFRFTKDLFRLVGVLAIVAFFGFIYTAIVLFYRGSDLFRILIRALDLVTIVVPPALPAVMSVGILYSTRRLKKNNIFCISPSTINTCGLIDVVCFDKTGTLTEDGLNFHAVRRVDANSVVFGDEETTMERDEQHQKMFEAMATCHSLTRMNGELSGDPLDEILFHQTCFSFEDDAVDEEHGEDCDVDSNGSDSSLRPTVLHSPDDVYGDVIVHRQFSFSSALQRMSVLVASSRKPNVITAYVKGSPEMIGNLCVEESVPEHFHEVIEEYTQHGFRLIAIASKSFDSSDVKVQAVTRNVVEKDLTLIGLVILENKLKSVTSEVIDRLNKARIRSVMVTGDNLLTALSVARECTIIKPNKKTFLVEHRPGQFDLNGKTLITITERIEGVSSTSPKSSPSSSDLSKLCRSDAQFAISGMTYAVICHEYPDLVQQLVCVCDVFARMAPDQKQMLVEQLQHASCTVAMCGDGANDCSALKSAHAGISLSDSEASIAAPFTSKVADIRCVPTIISEGRAALVTSFGSFLCMTSYSLTQFISILLLYWISGSYTQKQFLFIDLAIVTVLSCLFAHTAPYAKLANRPPPSRILSFHTLSGLFVHLTIGGLAQLLVFTTITLQPWFLPYQPPESHSNEDRRSMQGTAIFFVSTFHYIMIYVVFAKGPPFRSSVLTNVPFCLAASGLYLVCILILIWPIEFVLIQLECVMLPSLVFRLFILGVALIASTVSLTYSRVHDRLVQAIVDRYSRHIKTK